MGCNITASGRASGDAHVIHLRPVPAHWQRPLTPRTPTAAAPQRSVGRMALCGAVHRAVLNATTMRPVRPNLRRAPAGGWLPATGVG